MRKPTVGGGGTGDNEAAYRDGGRNDGKLRIHSMDGPKTPEIYTVDDCGSSAKLGSRND